MSVNIKKDFPSKKKQPDMTTMAFGKIPPQAVELEEAVLGACMLEKDTFEIVAPILRSHENFYVDAHQRIYATMQELYNEGSVIDLLTISARMGKKGELELVGGAYFLTRLTMSVTSSAHAEAHARIVYEKFMLRELIRMCGQAISSAYENADPFEISDRLEKETKEISEGLSVDAAVPVGETFMEICFDIEELQQTGNGLIGVDSGYSELNALLNGLRTSQTIVIAARPSQGKTAFAINIAENAVTSATKPAGQADIFSLETVKKSLVRRLAAARLAIPLGKIITGKISTTEKAKMDAAVSDFHKLPINIDDTSLSLPQILASIRRRVKAYRKTHKGKPKEKGGLELPYMAVVDYLQLVEVKEGSTREQQIAKISRSFKLLAKELDIIVILLAQISREAEKRGDGKPKLSDLRESGAIEQDADIVLMIWHEETDPSQNGGITGIKTHIIVAKNKDGQCGDVIMKFAGDIQRWKSDEESEEVEQASFLYTNSKTQPATNAQDSWDAFAGIKKETDASSKMFMPGGFQTINKNNIWNDDDGY